MKSRFARTAKLAGGLGLLLALALIASLSGLVLAIQPQPHQFIGYVRFCDETTGPVVPAGTVVLAKLAGVEDLEWTTTVDGLGRYGVVEAQGGTGTFKIDADDPATEPKEGGVEGEDTVEFWVLGYKVDEYPFEVWTLTRLDLVVPKATLTVEASPTGGGTVTGDGTYDCCTYAPITADPAGGYDFVNWTGSGITAPDSAETTVHMDGDKTVTANFELKVATYNLTVESDGCCLIDVTYDGFAEQVAAGDSQTFTGIPDGIDVTVSADDSDPCCQFDSWSDEGAQTHDIHMDGNKSVTAYCTPLTYDLTVESDDCCPIDVTYDGFAEQVAAGGSQTFTGIPCCTWVTVSADDSDPCCQFDSWSDGGAQTHGIHMDGNRSVTAYCTPLTYDLTVESVGCCPIEVTYLDSTSKVDPDGSQTFTGIPCCTWVTVSADDSDPCCQFDSWSDGGAQTHGIHMDGNRSVTAYCSVPTYDLTVKSDGCCPIDVTYDGFAEQVAADGSQTFTGIPCCTSVTVSADDSDPCCQFDSWSDGGAQTHDIHMDGDKSVTAYCSVPTYNLTVNSVGCCPIDVTYLDSTSKVDPGGSQTFTGIPCCTDVTVSADDSDPCCQFDSWSDEGAQTHDIHMDGNKSVTAYCTLLTYDLTVESDGCCPIDVTYVGGGGTVAAGGSQTFTEIPCCTSVTVSADDSDPCCQFDSWSDGGAQEHEIHMDGNKSVTAYCSVPTYDLTVESNGCCPIDVTYVGGGGTVAAGDSQTFTEIPCCTWVTVYADDTDTSCEFEGWSDGGAQEHEIHMDGNKSVTAYCLIKGPTCNLTVESNGCCPIDVTYEGFADQVAAGGSQTFTGIPDGTDVTVSADDSDPCCQFESWSDGGAQTHVIHMDSNKSVTATCSAPDVLLSIDLGAGWNTFSTPIALHPCCDTWGEFCAFNGILQDPGEIAYYFDPSKDPPWIQVTGGDLLEPLDGFYMYLLADGTADIIPNPGVTSPPTRVLLADLGDEVLYLVGLASLEDMDVHIALGTWLHEVAGGLPGYGGVISPWMNAPDDWYHSRYDYPDDYVPEDRMIRVGTAVWVGMLNDGTLVGWTYTPVS